MLITSRMLYIFHIFAAINHQNNFNTPVLYSNSTSLCKFSKTIIIKMTQCVIVIRYTVRPNNKENKKEQLVFH